MNLAIWILFGIVVGTAGYVSDSLPVKGGLAGSIAAGVIGSLLGGTVATYLFAINTVFDLPTFIIALSISVLVVFMHHTIFVLKRGGETWDI